MAIVELSKHSTILVLVLNMFIKGVFETNEKAFEAKDKSFHFGQVVGEEDALLETARSKQTFLYTIDDDKYVAVYDGLPEKSSMSVVTEYLSAFDNSAWVFNNHLAREEQISDGKDNVPWTNAKDPLSFSSSLLSKTMISAVMAMSGNSTPLYPYQVQGKVIRRLDETKVSADSDIEGEYSALLYTNPRWSKNWYGETYFYDSSMEIMCGVTPKFGRIVTWDASVPRLMRPPAVTFKKGQVLLHVLYTPQREKMEVRHREYVALVSARKMAQKKWYQPDYVPPSGNLATAEVDSHISAQYKTKAGHRIIVFDNLFSDDILLALRKHVLSHGQYFYDDGDEDPSSDNVQWIAGFAVSDYVKSPLYNVTKKAVAFGSGKTSLYPYDVAINIIRSADHTRIHTDCEKDEHEFTFLVYLNPDWRREYYGETVFFEPGKPSGDIVAEVVPKFGRSVLFEGIIPHSARPPSPAFSGARLSFAVKFSVNEVAAKSKTFSQEMRHYRSIATLTDSLSRISDNDASWHSKDSEEETSPVYVDQLEQEFEASHGNVEEMSSMQRKMDEHHEVLRDNLNSLFLNRL